jgi:excisionase family DNA binding protein
MTTEDEIMTKEQLAELLRVSKRTVERWVEEGRIPFIRLPRRGAKCSVRFLRSNVLRWLRRSEQKPLGKLHGLEVGNDAEQETEEAA